MSQLLKSAYQGFIFHPKNRHYHPIGSILILTLQFLLLLQDNIILLIAIFLIALIDNAINGLIKESLQVLKGIISLLAFVGLTLFIFSGIIPAIRIILRLITGAIIFSFFFSVTNPSDLTRSLERMKIPSKISIIPALTLTMVPRIFKDAEETLHSQALRGEMQGFPLKWIPKILAIFIASILNRAELLSQSLYFRGFGSEKRTHYKSVSFTKRDMLRIYAWSVITMIFLLFLQA